MDEPDVEIAFRAGSISVSQASSHTPSSNTCSKVLIQIIIPDHHWKFVYKVPTSTLVRELLRRVLSSCRLDVFEYANYGLYIPPTGTQKGKFLQEERLLSEYPQLLTSPADDLEDLHSPPFIDEEDEEQLTRLGKAASLKLIRKCRFVDALPLGHTRFKQINSKSHKKQLLGAIQSHNLQRIDILLDRGLDPNFQYKLNGDTPLCCAAEQWHPRELILKLVEKGAHLEFRDSETLTPLHRAARAGNFEAIKALLDLGQNPNVRDARDLTPLYHAVSKDVPTRCITQLLYDHAILGVMDDKNRQEIHQACLFDRPQHLEQLIIYGADLDAQAANLDTPLHICALNNHETCLRLLLKYGATRDLLNASGQTPSEVAMLTGLNRLAEVIDSFTDDQIAPVTKPPVYNQDRKPSVTGPRAAFENVRERLSAAQVNGFGQAPKPTVNNHMVWKDSVSTSNRVPTATGVPAQAKHCISSSTNDLVNRTVSYNSRASYQPVSRVVRLQRGSTGFGFQIRGRTVSSGGDSTSYVAANQYIDRIIPGSPAAEARLNPGDYILQINGQDVSRASHYQVTDLIVQSGSEVTLTVLPGPPRTLPSLQSPFQRNRSRLLISDRRHASCRRTSSSIAVRPDRSVSRDTSFGAPFCSSRSDRFLSQADEPSSASSSSVFYSTQRTTNAALNGIGSGYGASAAVGARDSRNVTVYREFQKRSVSSPYFEPYRSSSSRNSSSLSCNSGIDGMQTNHNYVNSVDFIGYNTNSSVSGCNSADVTHPRILLVHEDVDDDDAPITVDHVWPEENGDSIYRLSSSTQEGRITRSMDQWPHVSDL
ncbi:SH3 and multiple ankyrin repeat domains protein 3 [Fasciola hepatica]|uniref:SH3 and multiple ankyrin repeat domains protein 3 n=1 Tax=Fasciola hepatica TaxID=6192 RepID=A0A4E0R4A0_FASHE|nr:SH3 and multiple ankyrin repeat domains protein 3 [Fasciola hepatica]